jgi:hypothetical protein
VSGALTADEIFSRRPAPVPWPSWRPVLALAVEALPAIDDGLMADVVEHLAVALVDRDEELHAVRAVLSAALAQSHVQHAEIRRLTAALARLRDEYRALRAHLLQAAAA